MLWVREGLEGLELLAEVACIVAAAAQSNDDDYDYDDHLSNNQETCSSYVYDDDDGNLDTAANALSFNFQWITTPKKKRSLKARNCRQFPSKQETQKSKKQNNNLKVGLLGCLPRLRGSKCLEITKPSWSLTVPSPLTLKFLKV